MKTWKKVGLTALSASLISVSANAGALDVTGAASITFHSDQDSTGNPYTHNKDITFSGSGDLDNGMTVAYSYTMTDAAASDSTVAIGMGDGGTVTFGNVSGGVRAYDAMIPNAKEEAWDDLAGEANVVSASATANSFVYTGTFGGVDVTAEYNKNGSSNATDSSIGASYTIGDTGLTVGYAAGEDGETVDEDVMYVKYVIGGATLGYSVYDREVSSTTTGDREATQYGASFAVNENLSVSYGKATVDFGNSATDQESTGASISYTMGSITVAAASNKEKGTGGTSGSEDKMTEATVSFAF
tara:strand:- start:332 stop:1231 length:900 start_codon:yes stop_codon:yes gene_type:complete